MYHLIHILAISLFLLCTQRVKCDNSVCNKALGLSDAKKITDAQLSASSDKGRRFSAGKGRLFASRASGWCADDTDRKKDQWFQVDFNNTFTITSVGMAGLAGNENSYVKTFVLKYSYDGIIWHNYTNKGEEVLLTCSDRFGNKRINFPYPVTARFIRIYPRAVDYAMCMRVEFYGCTPQTDCTTAVGMEDGRIKDSQITASSTYNKHRPIFGRLHNRTNKNKKTWGAWCSNDNGPNEYLQIDLLRKRNVSKVATQGYNYQLFVKEYKLNYSTNGATWLSCQNKQRRIQFIGNTDNDTVKEHELEPMVTARFIRFVPTIWNYRMCMRVEIYECLPVKGSVPVVVNKPLLQPSDFDPGANVSLECTMKGQAGIIITWFRAGVLIKVCKNVKLKTENVGNNYVKSTLLLKNVTINENGAKFECRGRYPGVSSSFYSSYAFLLRVGVDQPPIQLQTITENSVETYVPYLLANKTVKYYFKFRAVSAAIWRTKTEVPSQNNIYSIKELKPWTKYELKVTPVHRDGYVGRTSKIERFTTKQGVPDAPENVRIIQVNVNNATVTWNKPSKNEIRGVIKKYIVQVRMLKIKQSDEDELIYEKEVVEVASTSCPIFYLLPDKNYTVQVAIENEKNRGPFGYNSFTTPPEIPKPFTTPKPKVEINLEKLNQIKIDDDNAMEVAKDVKNLTSMPDQLNPRNVSTTAEILKKIVDTNAKNSKVGDSILGTISNMLNIKGDVLEKSNSTSKFIRILENFVENGGKFSQNTSNIKIRVLQNLDERTTSVKQTFNNDSTILIPKEVLNKAKNKTMYFIYYKNGNLFKRKRLIKQICMDNGFTENVYEQSTAVMSSGISGETVSNLSEKVIIKFHVADPKAVTESSSCVYWDFDAAGGAGDWSNKGCKRQKMYNNTIECACDHMTNFAALIDVYAATSKVCGVHADVLQLVSYFGCILSIVGLSLTIFTYMFFRRLRKELAAKILIQLCIALLCVLIVFVVGIERSRVGPIGCYIVAVLLHYFILAAFLWMLVEAHFMYLAFVKVWSQHGGHELLKCSFIAWGLPAIVVGITMAVNLDNYGGDHYCRIEQIAFYAAFFAPVMFIIFVNLIVFGIIMYKLNTRPDSSLGRDRSAMVQRMKQVVGIMILVGVTWIFGALTISGARLIFNYLFVFFNSIQGFCIFLFYCLSQKNVRDCWKAMLTCQMHKLYKDKSFYTNTYDRRRCSTASTTHNNTMSLARKKTSTSSGNMAYPSHSMDTLTREFTSFNCTSGTLPGSKEKGKPNNLNNYKPKDCNLQNGTTSQSEIWKRMSNAITGDDETPNSCSTDTPLTRSNSAETLCSDDSNENCHSYDLVASSEGSLVSLHSLAESQASDNHGFYSFVNSKDSCNNSVNSGSAPNTPVEKKRPMPSPITRNNHLTVPPPTKRMQPLQTKPPHNDPLAIPDDFGKLIVNPSRGSVRGVRGVVETSVDTYDEDSEAAVTPQGVRLTQGFNNKQDKFGSNECIASPMYFSQNNRAKKDRNSSTNESGIGDVYL